MATSTVPDWMTTEFFNSCLQSCETQPITVTNYTIKPSGVPDGSNYGSEIFRVNVEFIKEDTQSSLSLIIKRPLANIEKHFGDVYKKEVKFYTEFINETYKYCKHDIVPRHYTSPNPRFVVLEDLNISGYEMVDRKKFLSLEHCELFIKSKAKLHALSRAVYRDNPEIIESLVKEEPTLTENLQKMNKSMVKGSIRCMIAYLEDNPHSNECLDIIKEASKNNNMWEMFQEVEQSSSNKPLKVLSQLDPWSTNMMFKYDSEGRVESIKLLDFQSLAFSSPLKEIVTFMSICPNIEVRKTKTTDLYNLYITTFNQNLADLGCPERLNYEEFNSEITAMSPLVLFLTCASVPFVLSEGAAEVDEYFSENILKVPVRESPIYKLYQNPYFIKIFPEFIDTITSEGVFDYVKAKMELMKPQ